MIIFATKRLYVRKITSEDAKALSKVLADPLVMQYSTVGVHSQEQIYDYIANCKKQYDLNGFGHWAVYNSANHEFVGVCGLNKHKVEADDIIHINYRLAADQQGKGYAVESVFGVLDFAKNHLKLSAIDSANVSSVKVINRTGFKFVKSSEFRGFNVGVYQVTL